MNDSKKLYFYARVFSDTNLYKVYITELQEFKYGAEVIINTEFGQNLAVITGWKTNCEEIKTKFFSSGSLIRYATREDKAKRKALDNKSILLKAQTNSLVESHQLKMNVTHVLIPLSSDSICIYYLAKDRVDFRSLLIDLRSNLKMKIILRQINQKERQSAYMSPSDLSMYSRKSL